MGTMTELSAGDGFRLAAYRADPEGPPRGGLVVVQEIFGVNSHIRSVCDGYAADGYRVIAPALFDRYEKGVDLGYTRGGYRPRPRIQGEGERRCGAARRRRGPRRGRSRRQASASSAIAGAA